MKKNILAFLPVPLSLLFMEVTAQFILFGNQISNHPLYLLLSPVLLGGLLTLPITFLKAKGQKIVTAIILFICGAYFAAVMVYEGIFHSFFLWCTIGLAGDVTQFYREALAGMLANWYRIVIPLLPFVIYLFIKHKPVFKGRHRERAIMLLAMLLAGGALSIVANRAEDKELIRSFQEDPSTVYQRYGIITSSGIDIWQTINGVSEEEVTPASEADIAQRNKTDVLVHEDKVIKKNAENIDWQAMIKAAPNDTIRSMHEYFQSRTASNQNDYTGYFAGKNLIFLTLEGFSYKALSPELTPTLYKMYTEGFHFSNFYAPMWGGSTATGEYANMTGNFYSKAVCLKMSANTLQYSAMGNIFARSGYNTYAYHNGTYTYYGRNQSHPNFGYPNFKAVGNGLKLKSSVWPNSDYEMAVATADEYMKSDKPFHTYYMTISGHTNYNFSGNVMARRHRSEVSGLKNSETVKAYIATEIEVENMMKYLIKKLEEYGKLEDTVFAMCCDHYPYGLSDEGLAELYGLPQSDVRSNFELYHNGFLLWSAGMKEPVEVETPCCMIDILPTLANLFGCKYDSRFIAGTDVFSDNENIAIINTLNAKGGSWNWKTTQGTYYTVGKKFVPSENCTLAESEISAYVTRINNTISRMKSNTFNVLNNDYYKYVFDKNGKPLYPVKN